MNRINANGETLPKSQASSIPSILLILLILSNS